MGSVLSIVLALNNNNICKICGKKYIKKNKEIYSKTYCNTCLFKHDIKV